VKFGDFAKLNILFSLHTLAILILLCLKVSTINPWSAWWSTYRSWNLTEVK